ncbi:MAG TPA: hypothetical protein VGO47_11425, partial [Chlamydiales bacterium]|nr:hypothetical protein [Chlamydiales bacterium]
RDANCTEKALATYQRRVKMGDWQEEVLWSWLQIGHLKNTLGYPYDEVLASYLQAHGQNPARSEPIYYMAELYNKNRKHHLAYECINNWQLQPKSEKLNLLFNNEWIEDYGFAFQLSIASFYIRKYQESLHLHDQLLTNPRLPENLRNQVEINRTFPLNLSKES